MDRRSIVVIIILVNLLFLIGFLIYKGGVDIAYNRVWRNTGSFAAYLSFGPDIIICSIISLVLSALLIRWGVKKIGFALMVLNFVVLLSSISIMEFVAEKYLTPLEEQAKTDFYKLQQAQRDASIRPDFNKLNEYYMRPHIIISGVNSNELVLDDGSRIIVELHYLNATQYWAFENYLKKELIEKSRVVTLKPLNFTHFSDSFVSYKTMYMFNNSDGSLNLSHAPATILVDGVDVVAQFARS